VTAPVVAELSLPVMRRRREVWEILIEAQWGRSGETPAESIGEDSRETFEASLRVRR